MSKLTGHVSNAKFARCGGPTSEREIACIVATAESMMHVVAAAERLRDADCAANKLCAERELRNAVDALRAARVREQRAPHVDRAANVDIRTPEEHEPR